MTTSVGNLITRYYETRDALNAAGGDAALAERLELRGKYVSFVQSAPEGSLPDIRNHMNEVIGRVDSRVHEILLGRFNEWDRKIISGKEMEGLPAVAATQDEVETGIVNFAARGALVFLSSECEAQKAANFALKTAFKTSRMGADDFITEYNIQDSELQGRISKEWSWKKEQGIA